MRQPVEQYAPGPAPTREDVHQPSLFDQPEKLRGLSNPLAPKTDPPTSHAAGERYTNSGRRESMSARVLDVLRASSIPLTFREVAQGMGADRHEVMKRLGDLRRRGLAEHCPEGASSISGEECITWRANP
jgi:hypothetical protein